MAIPYTLQNLDKGRKMDEDNYYDYDEWIERVEMFADPGGNSALRAASFKNPRNLPCPTCERKNMLTPADRSHGYQCDICANEAERGW
jgi:hypothetical protein